MISCIGALSAALLVAQAGLLPAQSGRGGKATQCILLFLVGGPGQLDTWDLKPDAPSHVRGPFRPIRTSVPGIDICEHFPLMAKMADRFAIVRSLHHEGGGDTRNGPAVDADRAGLQGRSDMAALWSSFIVFARPTFACDSSGADWRYWRRTCITVRVPGFRDDATNPRLWLLIEKILRRQVRIERFGRACFHASRLVERSVGFVTVNMFDSVFNRVTWDCHADGGSLDSCLDDYRTVLCPMFDRAYSALLDDLHQRGLLDSTLVVAMGEFGRTPQLNSRGGRDHWPGVWSILLAGGGVRGGQVIGSSDALAPSRVIDRSGLPKWPRCVPLSGDRPGNAIAGAGRPVVATG